MTITSTSYQLIAVSGAGAPPWVSYTGLVVSVVVAAGTITMHLRTHWRDQRKDGEEYAAKVSAWTGPDTGEGPRNLYRYDSIVVRNGADQPVFNVVAVLQGAEPGEIPGETDVVNIVIGLIPPGESVDKKISIAVPQEIVQRPVTIWFQDVRGRRWERDEAGQLRRRERVKGTALEPRTRRNDDGSIGPATPEPGAARRLLGRLELLLKRS
ncbi:hypothetical protein AB0F71_04770 [Kitasatospora sp. NPDC028055]|uniref:hypothetical protein n=1 Tax=Kitasatospora sp. NPDC028055 TaxID=3155653 RepID=UPI0033C29240